MPRKADLPTYLLSELEKATIVAELDAVADGIEHPEEDRPPATALEKVRAARLRDWARQTERYGAAPNQHEPDGRADTFYQSLQDDTAEQH